MPPTDLDILVRGIRALMGPPISHDLKIAGYGVIGNNDEPFYFCAAPGCVEVAKAHEDRMPLTQVDLNVQATLYPERRIQCAQCGIDLVVYGPDPRD